MITEQQITCIFATFNGNNWFIFNNSNRKSSLMPQLRSFQCSNIDRREQAIEKKWNEKWCAEWVMLSKLLHKISISINQIKIEWFVGITVASSSACEIMFTNTLRPIIHLNGFDFPKIRLMLVYDVRKPILQAIRTYKTSKK